MRAKTEEEREAEEETCVVVCVVCVAAVSHSDARTDGAREYAKATQTLLCSAARAAAGRRRRPKERPTVWKWRKEAVDWLRSVGLRREILPFQCLKRSWVCLIHRNTVQGKNIIYRADGVDVASEMERN